MYGTLYLCHDHHPGLFLPASFTLVKSKIILAIPKAFANHLPIAKQHVPFSNLMVVHSLVTSRCSIYLSTHTLANLPYILISKFQAHTRLAKPQPCTGAVPRKTKKRLGPCPFLSRVIRDYLNQRLDSDFIPHCDRRRILATVHYYLSVHLSRVRVDASEIRDAR